MKIPFEEKAKDLARNVFLHRNTVVLLFALASLGTLAAGLTWPKKYTSYATVLVEEPNIIVPLLAGTAVPTRPTDQVGAAREVIFARPSLNRLLSIGWPGENMSPPEAERVVEGIKARTKLDMVAQHLLKVQYADSDPERARRLTDKMVDIFISQSVAAKQKESHTAFDFIDKQAKEYEAKVAVAKRRLDELRTGNVDAWPEAKAEVAQRINTLSHNIDTTNLDLKEAQIRKRSLEKQLAGEAGVVSNLSREAQWLARIAELQSQLDTLRLSYHDTYPSIVRIRHQIEDLKQAVAQEREAGKQRGSAELEKGVVVNPLYQTLRSSLSEAKASIETLTARLAESQRMLDKEMERAQRIRVLEPRLAELTRDYEVNQGTYQDLLRRRENARVSMSLDQQGRGLTLKVQEPAFLPVKATGLRFAHFLIVGLPLGVLVPLAFLYGLQQIDPRVRFKSTIVNELHLPLVATLPHLPSPWERRLARLHLYFLGLLIVGVLGAYFWIAWMKATHPSWP